MSEVTEMNANSNPCKICDEIKDNGVRCGQPALTGERYCRFHLRVHAFVSPEDQMYELPILETEQSVQIALQHLTRGILSGRLSERKAKVMLAAIKTAAQLIRLANSNRPKEELLHEIAAELRGRVASDTRKPPYRASDPEAMDREMDREATEQVI